MFITSESLLIRVLTVSEKDIAPCGWLAYYRFNWFQPGAVGVDTSHHTACTREGCHTGGEIEFSSGINSGLCLICISRSINLLRVVNTENAT